MARRTTSLAAVLALALVSAGCSQASATRQGAAVKSGSTTTQAPTTTTTLYPTTTAPSLPPGRFVTDPLGAPFATVGGVDLVPPSVRVEHIGFHQSAVAGARELQSLPNAIAMSLLPTRDRGTGGLTAADVVVQPGTQVVAPVTGTVLRAGPYRLYCKYDDDRVVIQPDGHPSWIVVMLHITGVVATVGERVKAGVTPIAQQAHKLAFDSQVDKLDPVPPAWPHVHMEVDDPAIADIRTQNSSCGI